MGTNLHALRRYVGHKLPNAVLHVLSIRRGLHITLQGLTNRRECLVGIAEQQQALPMLLRQKCVHIDTD